MFYKKLLLIVVSLLSVGTVFAGDDGTLGAMGKNLETSISAFQGVLSTGSFLAGIGFAIGAIMKFKQHKDNPTNIPVGTPMALLFVAIALIFLPSLSTMVGTTMFGSGPQTGASGTFLKSQ